MDESKKTNLVRSPEFFKTYLSGKIIDIGAGKDLVCANAERFDLEDGDANHITQFRTPASYDAVHSSHCLEHMFNPKEALHEWWSLIKPGGYLVLIVPDEDLYEQGYWPSRFNGDHKATFTLKREKSWSPVSYNIVDLVKSLPNVEIISTEIQDQHYDYNLQTKFPPKVIKRDPFLLRKVRKIINRLNIANQGLGMQVLRRLENFTFKNFNVPIDQTKREALSQIQIVARKIYPSPFKIPV